MGGLSDLVGDNKETMSNLRELHINLDKNGNFKDVMYENKTYSIDDWNAKVKNSWGKENE